MTTQKKYHLIITDIQKQIYDKKFQIGDKLPVEKELCQKYNASRMTVHKALNMLAIDGYVKRIPGKGSYVNHSRVVKNMGSN